MSLSLEEKRKQQLTAEWEGYCSNWSGCGTACCFFEGSPCEHLTWVKESKKIGVCSIYERRFGEHRTLDGKLFNCVPMAEKLVIEGVPNAQCGYSRISSIEGVKVPKHVSKLSD